jgi:predicted ATPase
MASTNLPVQFTSFIGREGDLAELERLLFETRLVTLSGPGGCGKTRLAIQLANTISGAFEDGIWWVDLAVLRDPSLVPQLVVHTFGLRPASGQPMMESLKSFVRSKQSLLILDNCEHLDEACAQLARQLLAEAPEHHILATSREPLSISGETIYPVSGLAWPVNLGRVDDNPQELVQYDAVNLFVERARAISPTFTLTPENGLAVVDICQHLDGLPMTRPVYFPIMQTSIL